jgi:hypothetical protein
MNLRRKQKELKRIKRKRNKDNLHHLPFKKD